ncbi:hypothetical protein GMDG_08117 [Pseudogymnoascus destructans 20631-21]|uniref:Clr5 domain-containing protein n=1 Tax=Pseudogymnoascus destructans (strain ATCC MYA-4855 / 20631-21) TaxID=658429 RepID=L8G0M3_PSED2|nr:hypothetical protein GMDG_08117 [Pseudogymnoascus destructans 20631-21]
MEPSFKRQRISATQGQQRHSPGYDGHSRSYDPPTFRQPPNPINSAIYNRNNDSTKFYGPVNAREGPANPEDAEFDDDEESGEEFYGEDAPEADLQATRQELDNNLKSTFEAIFEKYGKDFTGVGDEIDLRTGGIIVDNGHVAEMHAETDAGEARGRGMLRAFTEEPKHARLPQEDVEGSDATDDAHEDTDTDYHARGRQMLRAFTQEPEFGRDEDENEYDGDTSKLNPIDEDESDDDDILYQSSGVIPAKSMAPPPRPPIYKQYQQKPQSRFHAPKSVPRQRLWSTGAVDTSEPDILGQFGQELGPRIVEYVSRQKSVDEGSIDPKWRTPALPAATAGKRPILKSMILQPDIERSRSPNGDSLWAPQKKRRRRWRKAQMMDKGPSGESETVLRDRTVIPREKITRSSVSAQAALPPKSGQVDAPQNPPLQDLASDSAGQNADDDPFGDNEPGNDGSPGDSAAGISYSPKLARRKNQRPGKKYNYVYHETEFGFWGEPHWELLSQKNPRHSGTAYRQRYRKFYDRNGGQHLFLELGMASQDAPKDSSVEPGPPTDSDATVRSPRLNQTTEGPPFVEHTFAKTMAAFQKVSDPPEIQPIPPAEGSPVEGTPKEAAGKPPRGATARFEPFKELLHKLYIVEGRSLTKVMRIMELQHEFTENHSQYRKHFREWGFKKTGHWWEQPEYAGMTYFEAFNKFRRKERKKNNQLRKMAMKGVILPTPDPDEMDQVEPQNIERRARRMKRLEKTGQLPALDHDETEQSLAEIGDDQGNDDSGPLFERGDDDQSYNDPGPIFERGDSYDFSKLLQGASDYISPNSATAMEGEDQMVELPKNRSEHNHSPEIIYAGRSLRSRVIPNSQSSQDLMSPSTSQAKQDKVTAPMEALSRDALDPSYMFSDEEDEAAPVAPQTGTSDPQTSSATTESPKPQPLSDSAPLITPPAQEPDVPSQDTPAKTSPAKQRDAVTTSVEIKDEPETVGGGLGDIYSLPRSPPRLPTAPHPATSGSGLRVIITQPDSSSPLTSPARTHTPPNTLPTSSASKATPKRRTVRESTLRRSQASLLRLSATPTPRRNPLERSTSRPRFVSRSGKGSVRSRASMTPLSMLAVRSPLRHDDEENEDEDGGQDVIQPLSRRSRAVGGGMSYLSTPKGDGAGASVTGTPSRRGGIKHGNEMKSEDGKMIQTPGGAWRRCGESGYKCGRGFCFRCSVGGEGEVGM